MITQRPRGLGSAHRYLPAMILLASATTVSASASAELRYDEIWSHAQLHEGAAGRPIESVEFTGRLQIDHVDLDAGKNELSDTRLRRLRLGAKVSFANHFRLHAEADYDWEDGQPVYSELTDAYFGWNPSAAVDLRVGKHSAPFTLDGMTSSTKLLTVDRNNLTNNIWFTAEYIPGISVGGDLGDWSYHIGVYSSGEANRGFGDSSGGEFWLGTVGYDLAKRVGVKRALLRLNVVDNEPHPKNGFTRPLEQVASLTFELDSGRWGVSTDLSSARGYLGQSDLQGFVVMPRFTLNDSLEFVGRYTRLRSDDANGVRFARYENEVVEGRGDNYRDIYLGLNYYLHGHKLKLQSGVQYAEMDDRAADGGRYTGWTWTTGFRISW